MMSKLLANRRSRLALVALPVLLALAACGHHDDDDNNTGGGSTNPPPVATSDSFITFVSQQVATQSETSEPLSTEGVNPTVPENTEPVALPAS
jgi:ABC-type Zn uptake system ZnuABC Zn-binding protein ZnuA